MTGNVEIIVFPRTFDQFNKYLFELIERFNDKIKELRDFLDTEKDDIDNKVCLK